MDTKKTKVNLKQNIEEINNLRNQLVRLRADFDNFQKRTETQKYELVKLANAELVNQILPILDNFKRAASHAPAIENQNIANWITGIQAIERQIEEVLMRNGLVEIKTEKGQVFDPNLHEAISHESNNLPVDTIIEVVETGYMLNEKVIRPTKVRVSSGIKKPAE